MRIGQKSKKFRCPYCQKFLRYRGIDENGKQIFSCKRPIRYTPTIESKTMVETVFKDRQKDTIEVGYCKYEIRV